MKDELKMGLRSILYRHKQYLSLFLVCMFGVGVSLFCLFSVRGMLSALEDKARIYYGGDLQFIGGWGLDQPVSNTELLVPFFPEDAVILIQRLHRSHQSCSPVSDQYKVHPVHRFRVR